MRLILHNGHGVQRPGSRGGRFHFTEDGNVRYGAPPLRAHAGGKQTAEADAHLRAHVEALIDRSLDGLFCLDGPSGRSWFVTSRNTNHGEAPYRVTEFDRNGIVRRTVGATKADALHDAIRGYPGSEKIAPGHIGEFEALSSTREFTDGNRRARVAQQAERLRVLARQARDAGDARRGVELEDQAETIDRTHNLSWAEDLAHQYLRAAESRLTKAVWLWKSRGHWSSPGDVSVFGTITRRQPSAGSERGYWSGDRDGRVFYAGGVPPDPDDQVEAEPEETIEAATAPAISGRRAWELLSPADREHYRPAVEQAAAKGDPFAIDWLDADRAAIAAADLPSPPDEAES